MILFVARAFESAPHVRQGRLERRSAHIDLIDLNRSKSFYMFRPLDCSVHHYRGTTTIERETIHSFFLE